MFCVESTHHRCPGSGTHWVNMMRAETEPMRRQGKGKKKDWVGMCGRLVQESSRVLPSLCDHRNNRNITEHIQFS